MRWARVELGFDPLCWLGLAGVIDRGCGHSLMVEVNTYPARCRSGESPGERFYFRSEMTCLVIRRMEADGSLSGIAVFEQGTGKCIEEWVGRGVAE